MAFDQPLRRLPSPASMPAGPRVVFCGHCGKPPADGVMPEVGSRVCKRCNLGLLLDAPASIVPKPNEAFLVVDESLALCGLSRRAERLLGIRELDAVDRRVTELLVPADSESDVAAPRALGQLLLAATAGVEDVTSVVLRPANEFGVRFVTRIGPCGPTPGALLVLDLG